MGQSYETVIGLEVHVELATRSKIFCSCSTEFGGQPNSHTCPVCTGLPGALPTLNKKAVEYAVAVGLATNCIIREKSYFDRKNYFYPDNPQNYQISQLYYPICQEGYVIIETEEGEKKIRIAEIHLEDDAGKLIHMEEEGLSLIDYNRSGVPLIEIVSRPDMNTAQEVIAYLEELRLMIQYLGVSDCKLNEGSMRVDVNLSVRRVGEATFGTRTEMKNLNSFKAITRAIQHETSRQIQRLEAGKQIRMETRRWDDVTGTSYSMRTKEETKDYRYFPEPDLLMVHVSQEWIDTIKSVQPRLPREVREFYHNTYHLPDYDIRILTSNRALSLLFEETTQKCGLPKKVSNWIMGELMSLLKAKQKEPEEISFSPEYFACLIRMTEEGKITQTIAKEVFAELFERNINPQEYVEQHGLLLVEDEEVLRKAVCQVISENPKSVQDYRNGKEKAIGYLVGQTMKQMEQKGNPTRVKEIILENIKDL